MKLFLLALVAIVTRGHCEKRSLEGAKETSQGLGDLINNITDKFQNKVCERKKAKGKIPSAEKKDSPIKAFGYPRFNIKEKSVLLEARVPLSYIGGFKQPIKIGAEDYIVSGTASELKSFFTCFGDYEIRGAGLNDNGKWVEDPEVSSVKIQVQNVMDEKLAKLTKMNLFEAVFVLSMEQVMKILKPDDLFTKNLQFITGVKINVGKIKSLLSGLEKMKNYIPDADDTIQKLKELLVNKKLTIPQKMKAFMKWRRVQSALKQENLLKWAGSKNISKTKKMIVTLTMYTKPESTVRASYDTKSAKLKLSEVWKALSYLVG